MSEDRRDAPQEPDRPGEDRFDEAEALDAEDETASEQAASGDPEDPISTDPSDPSEVPGPEGLDPAAVDPEVGDPEVGDPEAEEELDAEDERALLIDELEVARRERDDYLDGLRRLKAEFDNSRKRLERERERISQSASERLVGELLPVLDNLERALEVEGDVREGVRATRDQLVGVLGREGLVPIESDGEAFDPSVHEAVMGQPSEEHEDGTILQTFERGYALNGRAIRPAKVVVARQG